MISYNFLQQTPSLAAYSSSASQQIHHILQHSKLHYLAHNSSPLVPIPGQINLIYSKKIKCTLVQALRLCTGRTAHRGSRGIALLFLDHSTRRDEGSASRPGRSLPPGNSRYQLYRRLGGPHVRSGQVRKISPPPGFDHRTVQPVASRYTD